MTVEKKYLREARFIKEHEDVDHTDWPREPEVYHTTATYIERRNKLEDILEGHHVRDTIEGGDLVAADNGAVCFVEDYDGVLIYLIVGKGTAGIMEVRSIWPYVGDEQEALDTGAWLPNELRTIKSVVPKDPSGEF